MKIAGLAQVFLAGGMIMGKGSETTPLTKLDGKELEAQFASDIRQIEVERRGVWDVFTFMESRSDLFPRERIKESRLLRREEKEAVWTTWQRFGDYIAALGSVGDYHSSFSRLKGSEREDSFLIGTAAMLAAYRGALEFIDRVDKNPELEKVLNDAVPELGLPANSYAKLKFKFLNAAIATQFSARMVLLETFSGGRQAELRNQIAGDSEFLWNAGKGRGQLLTAKNALRVIQSGVQTAWLPVQTGVSEWMGHTKVYRLNQPLISLKQIRECAGKMEPGDILLERREWYLSNIGLPGFWSHAALYIGTAEERRAYFRDPDIKSWVEQQDKSASQLEDLLRGRYAAAYEKMLSHRDPAVYAEQSDPATDPVRIIEAISEGVSFHSLEHSAACDSLVVLRPKLSKLEKAQALLRAFGYIGRPYDFDFDFSTDAKLVCTELVYKCYEPASGRRGLNLATIEMLGRQVAPANEFARQFDQQHGTPEQQMDMVLFIDGIEREHKAVESTVEEFRQSWRRPKWHVFEPMKSE